jgi:hypothetical protein
LQQSHDVFDAKKETQVTFNEQADRYVENYVRQRSFEKFKNHMIKHLREVFGDKPLSEITYLKLETYRNRRKDTPTNAGKTRRDASVNREIATPGHILSKSVEWGML